MGAVEGRVGAVLAVLAGERVVEVAERLGVEPGALADDVASFLDGGRDRLVELRHDDGAQRRLAMTAHELLTPVTVIRGWTTTMRGRTLPPDIVAEALRAVDGSAVRLERLVRDLLDSVAGSLGRLRLVVGPVDLRAVADRVASDVGKGRTSVVGGAMVVGDEGRLEQIVINLVANAVAHGGGGPVVVAVSGAEEDALLSVTNDGIPVGDPAGLFEPYARGRGSEGSGLGLAVVRMLVEAHGGDVAVEVTAAGTTFRVRLPLAGPPLGLLVEPREPA